jgi:3-methyladenine DNA glycosylase AlkC
VAEPFKHRFLQRPFFEELAAAIETVEPAFARERFFARLYDHTWDGLELKGRMRHATEALGDTLPRDFERALAILLAVESRFSGFDHLLFADFVETYGVDHFEISMAALEVLTRTSAEFAVRPFIRRYPEQAVARMLAWTRHPSEHVRRLASEGCRPRLPWGTALAELKRDPSPILPILERLKDDPSAYVRRSVANNLGDIAKDHPALAVGLARRWMKESAARRPLVKHALRDLLKKGHPGALRLFGVGGAASVVIERLAVTPARVPLGGTAVLHIALRSTGRGRQRLRLEYAVTYARPGNRTGRKVFQIGETAVAAGATITLARKLSFADRTIRTHHPGAHAIALVVNGKKVQETSLTLVRARG